MKVGDVEVCKEEGRVTSDGGPPTTRATSASTLPRLSAAWAV
jgi:hypothetical protein